MTYDAPFFATLQQTVYLNLLETYPDLKLGKYFHFSDNTHFYERHFEIAQKIINEPVRTNIEIRLKEPLFCADTNIESNDLKYSSLTDKYINQVQNNIGNIQNLSKEDYQNLLKILFDVNETN